MTILGLYLSISFNLLSPSNVVSPEWPKFIIGCPIFKDNNETKLLPIVEPTPQRDCPKSNYI